MIFLCKYLFQDVYLLYRNNQEKTTFSEFTNNKTRRSRELFFSSEIWVPRAGLLLGIPVQCPVLMVVNSKLYIDIILLLLRKPPLIQYNIWKISCSSMVLRYTFAKNYIKYASSGFQRCTSLYNPTVPKEKHGPLHPSPWECRVMMFLKEMTQWLSICPQAQASAAPLPW